MIPWSTWIRSSMLLPSMTEPPVVKPIFRLFRFVTGPVSSRLGLRILPLKLAMSAKRLPSIDTSPLVMDRNVPERLVLVPLRKLMPP